MSYLAELNLISAVHFHSCLYKYTKMYNYVSNRISNKCIDFFKIGYCPRSGYDLFSQEHGIKVEDAFDSGILYQKDFKKCYLSGRITIPIKSCGLVVGFSGRSLNGGPKYLNTKSTMLYSKSDILYGFDISRKFAWKRGYLIIVEGYFDFLTLFDRGVHNVAALGGVALTKSHANIIGRYVTHVVRMLDPDGAGQLSSDKASVVLGNAGISSSKFVVPDNLDPDEYITKVGTKQFEQEVLKSI